MNESSENPHRDGRGRPIRPAPGPLNVWFRLLIPAGVVFCGTILATLAAAAGNPDSGVNRWIARNSTALILAEAAGISVLAIAAMWRDGGASTPTGDLTNRKR